MSKNSYKIEFKLLKLLKENTKEYKRFIKLANDLDLSFDYNDLFLGFIDIYYKLSKELSKDYTIIDIGCSYNLQN